MKLFYLILAHTNLPQVNRMINALQHEQAEFFIHFDVRVPLDEIRKCPFYNAPGVTILRNRHKINWGGYNMVRATLGLIRAACKKKEAGYLILLSGQDFPLKSTAFIYDFLKKDYGREYLEYFSLPSDNWALNNGLDRIQYLWFVDTIHIDDCFKLYEMQKYNEMSRKYFHELPPYGGSQWWCITTECADYLLRFLRNNPVYEEYFQYCFIPDETFFNTIIMNSPFKERTVNNNLKYIVWPGGGAHPLTFTLNEWDMLMQCDRLWARKFVDQGNSPILDRLEAHIGQASPVVNNPEG